MNKIKSSLKKHYNLDVINILPQKGGWSALAFKVLDNHQAYFLKYYEKSRASTQKWTALIDKYIPIMLWLLENSRFKGKIPVPLLTKNGAYQCEDEDGIYLFYKYIEGETIGEKDLNKEQVNQFSEIIAELHLHGEGIPIETDAIKEDFYVPFLEQLRGAFDRKDTNLQNDVRKLIYPYIEQVHTLIETVDHLSQKLKSSHLRMALCHTDLHNWNLMRSNQQLILIDWEGLKLAPVEADLMFLIDKPYYEEFLSIYQETHENFVINDDALKFYQDRRKLEDIWEFTEQLLYDNQSKLERNVTLSSLTKELKNI